MPKDKKSKVKKSKNSQNPSVNNDQLGENASESLNNAYDNKKRKNK